MTTEQIAQEALDRVQASNMGACLDAGFDGGEWSGPQHAEMLEDDLNALAKTHGLTMDNLEIAMNRLAGSLYVFEDAEAVPF